MRPMASQLTSAEANRLFHESAIPLALRAMWSASTLSLQMRKPPV
jgi:hypothetical protein